MRTRGVQSTHENETCNEDTEEPSWDPSIHGEDIPSPSNDGKAAAKVATQKPKESESEPKEAARLPINLDTNKPESNDGSISSGLDISPMDAILEMVNSNLRNCPCHPKTPLVLEPHRRVGFASNWKLTCLECEIEAKSVENSITYLKSNLDSCKSNTERRSIKRKK